MVLHIPGGFVGFLNHQQYVSEFLVPETQIRPASDPKTNEASFPGLDHPESPAQETGEFSVLRSESNGSIDVGKMFNRIMDLHATSAKRRKKTVIQYIRGMILAS